MKLVVESIDGQIFVYRETEQHHRKVQPVRSTPRLDPKELDVNCDVTGRDNFHVVFTIK